jgi:DNA mismatch repair protein MutL
VPKKIRIKILDPRTIEMISAGEVVERPASVVKELVENSIDAGSSRISIDLGNAGRDLVQVIDNGAGMNPEEMRIALQRHSTSKIDSFSDLEEITTLGFRGEALPSIAAVSRLEILSRTAEQDTASRITVRGGEVTAEEETTRSVGTTVIVRDLFFNTPARKRFLKTKGTELRRAMQVVTEIALSNPAISWLVRHDGKCLLECEATDNLLERVACIFSNEQVRGMIPVKLEENGVEIHGLISRPEDVRKGSAREYLFVNSRPIRSVTVRNALRRSYRATLKAGLKPDYFLFLKIPPAEVDVNVHPMKQEVKFRDEKKIVDLIEQAATLALSSPESIPSYERNGTPEVLDQPGDTRYGFERQRGTSLREEVDQMSFLFTGAGVSPEITTETVLTEQASEEVYYPSMVQVHNTFILVQTRKGLLVVDQHASHERILYEKLIDSFTGEGLASQKLLFPLTFHLSPAQYTTAMEYLSHFRAFGFDIEPFGGKSVIIHSVPSLHDRFEVETTFREMIDELNEGAHPEMKHHEQVAKAIACKAALKAGQPLSKQEMSELFDMLFATRVPSRDIHGRPTMVQIGIDELKKRFERG